MDWTEFENDRCLDPNQLDVAALEQAEIFFKWSQRSSGVHAEFDRLKIELERTRARVEMRVRKKPARYGIGRISEAAIAAAVVLQPQYARRQELLVRAKQQMLDLDAAVEALNQRKRMIELLVTLHGQEYFAGPAVPRDLVVAWNDRRQQLSAAVDAKVREKTRVRRHK